MSRSHFVWIVAALFLTLMFSDAKAESFETVENSGWEMAEIIESDNGGSSSQPDVDMDAQGNAIAVWELYESSYYYICTNRHVKGVGWGEVQYIGALSHSQPNSRISMDHGGNATAVWIGSNGVDHEIVACRYHKDLGWGESTILDSSSHEGFYPRVDMDENGNAMVVWYRSDGTFYSIFSSYYKVGTGWGPTIPVETSNSGHAYYPVIATAPDGTAVCVWHMNDGGRKDVWTNIFKPLSGWGTPRLLESEDVEDAIDPCVDMDDNGNALGLWLQSKGSAYNVMACLYTKGEGWGEPENIETLHGTVNLRPNIAMDPSGNGFATWSQMNGSRYSIMVNRFDRRFGWGDHVVIDEGDHNSNSPHVDVDPSGNACIVWVRNTGSDQIIFSSSFIKGIGWTEPEMIEQVSGRGVAPRVGMDQYGNSVAVWYHNDGRRYNVWANRFNMPDLTPPEIDLVSPDEGAEIDISSIAVSGTTEPGAKVIVNGVIAFVSQEGSFSLEVSLFPGPNTITVRSEDPSGNHNALTRTVTYNDPVPGMVEDIVSIMVNLSELQNKVEMDNLTIHSMIEVLEKDSNLMARDLISLRENITLLEGSLNATYDLWMKDAVMMLGILQDFLNDTIEAMKDDQDEMEEDIDDLRTEHDRIKEDLQSLESGEGDLEEEVDSLRTWETILAILVVFVIVTGGVAFLILVLGQKKQEQDGFE